MKGFFYHYRIVLLLVLAVLLLSVFSIYPHRVEHYYTYGVYPFISRFLRLVFGWLPLSIGDILYFLAGCYLVYKVIATFRFFKKQGFTCSNSTNVLKHLIIGALSIYLLFMVLWGLNYYRTGIASQLALKVEPYTTGDLDTLASVLQERLNAYAPLVDTAARQQLNNNAYLFDKSIVVYQQAAQRFPFLAYRFSSIKPSLYSSIGQYIGFTGYYNPFTGEAQLKTSVPVFIKPFVITHEMAHQLGYAKENEANFVAFLACHSTTDINFRYSVYFELFWYTLGELSRRQAPFIVAGKLNLHRQVIGDYDTMKDYLLRTQNPIEPYMSRFYDRFLKWNNQPGGTQTYNQVVAWLIAYQKKMGVEAI